MKEKHAAGIQDR